MSLDETTEPASDAVPDAPVAEEAPAATDPTEPDSDDAAGARHQLKGQQQQLKGDGGKKNKIVTVQGFKRIPVTGNDHYQQ